MLALVYRCNDQLGAYLRRYSAPSITLAPYGPGLLWIDSPSRALSLFALVSYPHTDSHFQNKEADDGTHRHRPLTLRHAAPRRRCSDQRAASIVLIPMRFVLSWITRGPSPAAIRRLAVMNENPHSFAHSRIVRTFRSSMLRRCSWRRANGASSCCGEDHQIKKRRAAPLGVSGSPLLGPRRLVQGVGVMGLGLPRFSCPFGAAHRHDPITGVGQTAFTRSEFGLRNRSS